MINILQNQEDKQILLVKSVNLLFSNINLNNNKPPCGITDIQNSAFYPIIHDCPKLTLFRIYSIQLK